MAVKKGVVAPIAWLKLTGMYLSDRFPKTIVRQKMVASRQILDSCFLLLRGLMGVHFPKERRYPRVEHANMWHSVKNTGRLKQQTACTEQLLEAATRAYSQSCTNQQTDVPRRPTQHQPYHGRDLCCMYEAGRTLHQRLTCVK